MSIDLTIPGNTTEIRAVATWLGQIAGDLDEQDYQVLANLGDSPYSWAGESGDAYRDALRKLTAAEGPVAGFARDLAEVMNAYAGQLERGRETFGSYSRQAYNRGLVIVGLTVRAPTTALTYCPADSAPAADIAEYDRYVRALADYDVVATAVGEWWGELELWVAEHFGPLAARIEDLQEISDFAAALHEVEGTLIDYALNAAEDRANRDYKAWRELAELAQSDYDLFRGDLNSGHPGIKAAAEAVDFKGLKSTIRALNAAVDVASKYARVIPIVGGVVDVVAAGIELADGGSPTSVGAGLLGGLGGGLLVGGLVSGPVGWVALAVTAGTIAGSEAATWLWEAAVPLEQREAIDAGLQGEDLLFAEEVYGLPATPQPDSPVYYGQSGPYA